MHRRFGDRLLSVFNPVRRYGCTNHLCAHEAILWKSSALWQRPIVAIAGLAGAALAGALVTGLGLYAASDASTRAEVRDAYSSAMQPEAANRPDATLALPVSRLLPEPRYETASTVEMTSDNGDLKATFMPPIPTLHPAVNPRADSERRAESE